MEYWEKQVQGSTCKYKFNEATSSAKRNSSCHVSCLYVNRVSAAPFHSATADSENEAREEGIREGHASGLKEGHASGLKEGRLQKLQEQIEKKVQKGYCAEEIAEMLETDIETVRKFIEKYKFN